MFIKLGGSVITDINKPYFARIGRIRSLIEEIKSAKNLRIIIGHGGGSFPHVPAHKYNVDKGFINAKSRFGATLTQRSAADLNAIIINEMIKKGMTAFTFPPSAGVIAENRTIKSWNLKPLQMALEKGFIPVTYGDLVLDKRQGVCIASTEEVFRYMAHVMKPKLIAIGTDVDGVFDSDPKVNKNAKIIKSINSKNIEKMSADSGKLRKFNVTGGMASKIKLLYKISRDTGAKCVIFNATVEGRLSEVLNRKTTNFTLIDAKDRE